ncbi:MAG: zf-HC2 domain-containing protein [Terriglobales bacterium]
MKCTKTKTLLSSYLDGAVTGKQMCEVQAHLAACGECSEEYALLRQTQRMVAALGRKRAPEALPLKLRVALSQEAARGRRSFWESMVTRMENAAQAFMLPATAGVLSAVIFFGLLIGFFALPTQLQASGNDVPTVLYTPPELRFSLFEIGIGAINADSIVVEVSVDANGRVQDYQILSPTSDLDSIRPQLDNMLIFTVFRPATSFGQPVTSKTVLSLSKVNVRG